MKNKWVLGKRRGRHVKMEKKDYCYFLLVLEEAMELKRGNGKEKRERERQRE